MSKKRSDRRRKKPDAPRPERRRPKNRAGAPTPAAQAAARAARRRRMIVVMGLLVITAGGLTALGLWRPAADPVVAAPPGFEGRTPAPYEYDPITNRHWHPAHAHWHDGPPPGFDPTAATNALAAGGLNALTTPVQQNPEPWTYDPATNKHWDPNHGHWHDGPPPADRTTPANVP